LWGEEGEKKEFFIACFAPVCPIFCQWGRLCRPQGLISTLEIHPKSRAIDALAVGVGQTFASNWMPLKLYIIL
jgi:hypothetical protein